MLTIVLSRQLMKIKFEVEIDTDNQADCARMAELMRIFEELDKEHDDYDER